MADLNRVLLIGNLTSDPQMRQTSQGKDMAWFGLAVNQRYRGEDDEIKENVCFLDVIAWGRLARICAENLKKGSRVFIEGRLQLRSWEEDGDKRSKLEVVARKVFLLSVLKSPHFRPEWGDDRTEP